MGGHAHPQRHQTPLLATDGIVARRRRRRGRPAPPPSDTSGGGSEVALEQFVAAGRVPRLHAVRPGVQRDAHRPTTVDTYTCYAITASGEPFIARTTLGSTDVIEFEILAEPTQSLGPTAPADTATPDTATSAKPEPASVVRSAGLLRRRVLGLTPTRWRGCRSQTLAGSPADAYLRYQTEFSETRAEYDAARSSRRTSTSPRRGAVCLTADECVELADFQVIDGQLANFTVDANAIAPRLGRTGPVFPDRHRHRPGEGGVPHGEHRRAVGVRRGDGLDRRRVRAVGGGLRRPGRHADRRSTPNARPWRATSR